MYAITLHAQWARAIIHGPKRIENRTWLPKIRFPRWILIHAGKQGETGSLKELWPDEPEEEPIKGAIIGAAFFSEVLLNSSSPWFLGPYGWKIEKVLQLEEPIPRLGQLALWRPGLDIQEKLPQYIRNLLSSD